MPQVKTLAGDLSDIHVLDQHDNPVDLFRYSGRQVKRASRVGDRIIVHLVGAAPGELLVFSPSTYEKAVRRTFVPPSRKPPNQEARRR
jgi:hypothetical protein